MTPQETPDPLGFLQSHPTPVTTAASSGEDPVRPVGVYATRRELRAQREAADRADAIRAEAERAHGSQDAAAELAALVRGVDPEPPGVPVAPASVSREAALVPARPERARTPKVRTPKARTPKVRTPKVRTPKVRTPKVRTAKLARKASRRAGGRRVDTDRSTRTARQRITGTATMLLVGGLFASLTLPAYALTSRTTAAPVIHDGTTQNLSVSSKAGSVAAAARDGYGATSFADLRAAYTASIRSKNAAVYSHSTAASLGDDYPWYNSLTRSQGGGLSPLRYYYRECVDFVAWRLNRDAGFTAAPFKWDWSTLTPGGGDAYAWKSAWANHGWATGSTPQAGAVAWFPGNHVAYVKSVLADGTVLLEEYNYGTDHQYDQRIVAAGDVALYLYAPPR